METVAVRGSWLVAGVDVELPRTSLTPLSLLAANWFWQWTSPTGCGRTRTPRRSGSCATPTAVVRISTCWFLAGHTRSSWYWNVVATPGPRRWTFSGLRRARMQPSSQPGRANSCGGSSRWDSGASVTPRPLIVVADPGYDTSRPAYLLATGRCRCRAVCAPFACCAAWPRPHSQARKVDHLAGAASSSSATPARATHRDGSSKQARASSRRYGLHPLSDAGIFATYAGEVAQSQWFVC